MENSKDKMYYPFQADAWEQVLNELEYDYYPEWFRKSLERQIQQLRDAWKQAVKEGRGIRPEPYGAGNF